MLTTCVSSGPDSIQVTKVIGGIMTGNSTNGPLYFLPLGWAIVMIVIDFHPREETMRVLLSLSIALLFAATGVAQYGDISDVKLLKLEDREDVKSVPAPEGAVVLLDGKSLDKWTTRNDAKKPASWKLLEGGIAQVQGGDMVTKDTFGGSFKLHVEFRVPYMPKASGQGRGNSGVYLQGRYEVQVLDSYGLDSKDNDCGGIYGIAKPLKNACKAPTVWQSYDIDFHSPKIVDGKKTMGRITVLHNGIKIHDDVKLTKDNTTAGAGGDPGTPGPILLQDHGNPVQYRNIWLKTEK